MGIESSNPISRSLKCCPRERERVRENNRITLHWAQQDVRQESDEEGAGNGNGGLIRIKIEEETEQYREKGGCGNVRGERRDGEPGNGRA